MKLHFFITEKQTKTKRKKQKQNKNKNKQTNKQTTKQSKTKTFTKSFLLVFVYNDIVISSSKWVVCPSTLVVPVQNQFNVTENQ